MAKGLNKVILMGNLARDPEVRYTIDRRAWTRFTVAVNYSWKNKNGEFQDGVDFIPVVAWGPLGENCGRYLRKGRLVLVEGRIQTRSVDANDGSGKKYFTDVQASDVTFLGGRQGEGDPAPASAPSGGPAPFPDDDGFGRSIHEKGFDGFGGDFPMDYSEAESGAKNSESDIPF